MRGAKRKAVSSATSEGNEYGYPPSPKKDKRCQGRAAKGGIEEKKKKKRSTWE